MSAATPFVVLLDVGLATAASIAEDAGALGFSSELQTLSYQTQVLGLTPGLMDAAVQDNPYEALVGFGLGVGLAAAAISVAPFSLTAVLADAGITGIASLAVQAGVVDALSYMFDEASQYVINKMAGVIGVNADPASVQNGLAALTAPDGQNNTPTTVTIAGQMQAVMQGIAQTAASLGYTPAELQGPTGMMANGSIVVPNPDGSLTLVTPALLGAPAEYAVNTGVVAPGTPITTDNGAAWSNGDNLPVQVAGPFVDPVNQSQNPSGFVPSTITTTTLGPPPVAMFISSPPPPPPPPPPVPIPSAPIGVAAPGYTPPTPVPAALTPYQTPADVNPFAPAVSVSTGLATDSFGSPSSGGATPGYFGQVQGANGFGTAETATIYQQQ